MIRIFISSLIALGFVAGSVHAEEINSPRKIRTEIDQEKALKIGGIDIDIDIRPRRPRRPRRDRRRRDRRSGPFKRWQCYAENRHGDLYAARSKQRWLAMDKALNKCERRNRRCWRAGCELVSRLPF